MKQPTPTILIDSREQRPLTFTRFKSQRATLQTGDYSVAGLENLFAIERKSVPDLVMSVTRERERFERELHRLRGFWFSRLLIIGSKAEIQAHRYRSGATPRSLLHSLSAMEVRYSVPVVWEPRPEDAAALVEQWAYWCAREVLQQADVLTRATDIECLTPTPTP